MLSIFRSLARDRRGAAMIDYSLIAAIVAVAGISAMLAIGKAANATNTAAVTLT